MTPLGVELSRILRFDITGEENNHLSSLLKELKLKNERFNLLNLKEIEILEKKPELQKNTMFGISGYLALIVECLRNRHSNEINPSADFSQPQSQAFFGFNERQGIIALTPEEESLYYSEFWSNDGKSIAILNKDLSISALWQDRFLGPEGVSLRGNEDLYKDLAVTAMVLMYTIKKQAQRSSSEAKRSLEYLLNTYEIDYKFYEELCRLSAIVYYENIDDETELKISQKILDGEEDFEKTSNFDYFDGKKISKILYGHATILDSRIVEEKPVVLEDTQEAKAENKERIDELIEKYNFSNNIREDTYSSMLRYKVPAVGTTAYKALISVLNDFTIEKRLGRSIPNKAWTTAFLGAPGTGKSKMVEFISQVLDVPYGVVDGSQQVINQSDLVATIMPKVAVADENLATIGMEDEHDYVMVLTPLGKILLYGGICEVQEINMLLNPLDTSNWYMILQERKFVLPNGRVMSVNNNAHLVFTMNTGPKLKTLPTAFYDRLKKSFYFEAASAEVMAAQVNAQWNNSLDMKQLVSMADLIVQLRKFADDPELLSNRALEAWVQASLDDNIYDACIPTVINKASQDRSKRFDMIGVLDNSPFAIIKTNIEFVKDETFEE